MALLIAQSDCVRSHTAGDLKAVTHSARTEKFLKSNLGGMAFIRMHLSYLLGQQINYSCLIFAPGGKTTVLLLHIGSAQN